jgi:hypothetical protein
MAIETGQVANSDVGFRVRFSGKVFLSATYGHVEA